MSDRVTRSITAATMASDGQQTATADSVVAPTINSSNINPPTVNTPSTNSPTINDPTVNTPPTNTPKINPSTASSSNNNPSTINTPTINTPAINTPTINTPTINTPTTKASTPKAPTTQVPATQVPATQVPTSKTFTFQAPATKASASTTRASASTTKASASTTKASSSTTEASSSTTEASSSTTKASSSTTEASSSTTKASDSIPKSSIYKAPSFKAPALKVWRTTKKRNPIWDQFADEEPLSDHENDFETEPTEPPAKRPRVNFVNMEFSNPADIVHFYIGEEKVKFSLHKEVVIVSPVLKAAFTGRYVENDNQEYHLVDTTEQAFRYLTQWLYSENFAYHIDLSTSKKGYGHVKKELQEKGDDLVKLWVLADRLLLSDLQNLTIEKLRDICTIITTTLGATPIPYFLPLTDFDYVKKNTTRFGGLRRFLVRHCVIKCPPTDYDTANLPHYIIHDAAVAMSKMIYGTIDSNYTDGLFIEDFYA